MKARLNHVVSVLAVLLLTAPQFFAQSSAQSSDTVRDKAAALIQQMTLQEKIDYIGGTGMAIRAIPRLHLPAFEMSDGPIGVRPDSGFPSTVYAAGIGLAASWNVDLAERVGEGIGKDARARGIHFMLGPGVNIYRQPVNGRNFEYFGEDPFLSSSIAVGYITGMQRQGVSATVKHFLGNNSEFLRHDSDSIIDERTLREIYLPAFEAAVKRGNVGAVMDSYNFTNGQHMTQNGHFNIDVARKEWGFRGVMMSDWDATYDGVAAASGGLDLEMPKGAFMNTKNLLPAIKDGRVKTSTIDEKIAHILETAIRFGWLDRPQTDLSLPVYNEQTHQIALDSARESMVLLKNDGHILPLDKSSTKSVLVVGPDAYPAQPVGGGSAHAVPFAPVSVLQGLSDFLKNSATVYYDRGIPKLTDLALSTEFMTAPHNGKQGVRLEAFDNVDLSGSPKSTQIVKHLNAAGTTWESLTDPDLLDAVLSSSKKFAVSHRWTGYYIAAESGPYEIAVQGSGEGSGSRVFVDGKLIIDNWKLARALQPHVTVQFSAGPHKIVAEDFQTFPIGGTMRIGIADQRKLVRDAAKALAAKADVVVIAAGFDPDSESEGSDRTFDLPFGQEELIRELSAINPKTVVVVTSGGNVDPGNWIDHVPAYLEMWYPGEAGGTALAEILFGAVNPSGHLPATFERRREDNPTFANYYPEGNSKRVEYKESVFVGYRGYEHNGVKALFPFGYGLSYTTFEYANLTVAPATDAQSGALYNVSFDLTNNGNRAGAEVAQVYVADDHSKIARPAKELKGFAKVVLEPGETRHVTIPLDARSFAYFDPTAKQWHITPGAFGILVGSSSETIALKGSVVVSDEIAKAKM